MLLRRRAQLRKEPSQARSAFTFDSILDAAQQMIIADGAAALQMSALTRRAGVSAGTLYQYFPDKTSILMALQDRCWARFGNEAHQLLHAMRGASVDFVLEQLSTLVAETVTRTHPLSAALRAGLESVEPVGEEVDLTEKSADFIGEVLRGALGVPEEQLQALTRMIVWTADGLVEGTYRREAISADEIRAALLSAWRGLLGLRPNASPDPREAA